MTTHLRPPDRWWRARALHEALLNVLAAADAWERLDTDGCGQPEYDFACENLARAVRRFRDLELPEEQGGDDGCRGR
jgi:hypothetical protein